MIGWADGEWRDDAQPGLSTRDRGFALGDGLFETVLWENGAPVRLSRHVTRLHAAAAALGLPAPPSEADLAATLDVLADRNGARAQRLAIRIVWTAGVGTRGLLRTPTARGSLFVTAAAAPAPAGPARVGWSAIRRNETAPTARWKTLSYLDLVMARAEAHARDEDEALMLNTQGRLACASAANVFVIRDGVIATPPIEDGALAGTVRATLLDSGLPISVATIAPDDVRSADAIVLTNALIGVRAVSALETTSFAADHPLVDALRAALVRTT